MSQWSALSFVPPMNGKPRPSARWTVPSIFSSKSCPHVPLDPGVAADPELAEAARALVGVEQRPQEVRVRLGRGLDDATGLEAQAYAAHVHTAA